MVTAKRTSPALCAYWERMKEIGILYHLSGSAATLGTPVRRRESEVALCRSTLVLLCSNMEGFYEDLAVDILQFHEHAATSMATLPKVLRVKQLWKKGLDDADDMKKWCFIEQVRRTEFADDNETCTKGIFTSDLHTRGFSSPGSKAVAKLLGSVGLQDYWGKVEGLLNSRILENSLDSLVGRRNPIAHGDASATATPGDVRKYIEDMCKLARSSDTIAHTYLTSEFSHPAPWSVIP